MNMEQIEVERKELEESRERLQRVVAKYLARLDREIQVIEELVSESK